MSKDEAFFLLFCEAFFSDTYLRHSEIMIECRELLGLSVDWGFSPSLKYDGNDIPEFDLDFTSKTSPRTET